MRSPQVSLILAVLILGISSPPTAIAQTRATHQLTLEEAVGLALAHNEQVVVALAEVDRTRGRVTEVRSRALPQLDFSYDFARNVQRPVIFFDQGGETQQITIGEANDNIFALSLKQTLFDPSLGAALRAARSAGDVSAQNAETARRNTALAVKTAYYRALLNAEEIDVVQKALDQARARLDQVEEKIRAQVASEFDLLTAQVAVENLKPPLIEAQNEYQVSLDGLKRLVRIPIDDSLVLGGTLEFPSTEPLTRASINEAVFSRSDWLASAGMVEMSEAAVSAERRATLPTLNLDMAFLRFASSREVIPETQNFAQSFVVALRFDWPLFDGRKSEGRLQQAQATLRQTEERQAAVEENIRLEIAQARTTLESARAQVESSGATVGQAERALEIGNIRFASGLSTQVELSDSELAVTRARANLARALFRYNVARAYLVAAMGRI